MARFAIEPSRLPLAARPCRECGRRYGHRRSTSSRRADVQGIPSAVRKAVFELASGGANTHTTAAGAVDTTLLARSVTGALAAGTPEVFGAAVACGVSFLVTSLLEEWERGTRGEGRARVAKAGLAHWELWAYVDAQGNWVRTWWPQLTYGDLERTLPHAEAEYQGHGREVARIEAAIADFKRYGLPLSATIEALEACTAMAR